MKVNDTSDIRPVDKGRTAESRWTQGGPSAPSDTVSTDAKARLETAVTAARRGAGGDRAARLEAIEAAIRQGTFKPDPQRIAQKILDDAELTAVLQSMLQR